jgi:hypothetical protein
VDAADDEDALRRVEIADLDRDNRAAVDRPAEDGLMSTGRVGSCGSAYGRGREEHGEAERERAAAGADKHAADRLGRSLTPA